MKRIHIGLQVDDIDASIEFYTKAFGVEPTMLRPDYAKWMLDDPLVNFSLDTRGDRSPGSAHYGIELATPDALEEARDQIDGEGLARSDQDDLVCGYQLQHKSWVTDPNGLMWEFFHTTGVLSDGYGTAEMPATSAG